MCNRITTFRSDIECGDFRIYKSITNRPAHLYLLLVFWHQQFLVGHGPFGLDPTGCWPVTFSCFPCHWLKTSRSSLCGCVPFSSASIPVCLKSRTRKIILIIINNNPNFKNHHFDWPVENVSFVWNNQTNQMRIFFMESKLQRTVPSIGTNHSESQQATIVMNGTEALVDFC